MPATKIGRRGSTLARTIGSGFAGAALVATVLASSPAAAAATDDVPRVALDSNESVVEIDLWRAFRNCLSEYYAALDAMYPTSADVNECLEDRGLL